MKIAFKILICLLIIGCTSQTKKNEQAEPITENKVQSKYVDLSKKHIGFWVNEGYFNALKETQSTKKAGEMGVDDFYRISDDNSIMRMNIHEGGAKNLLLMNSITKGQIYSQDTSESYFKIEFRDGLMIAENKNYLKTIDNEKGFIELVNSAFIVGKYRLEENEVELKNDGTVIGLDNVQSYVLNLDYNDAGMQIDKIHLQPNEENETKTYSYEYSLDSLFITDIKCKTFEDDFCVEIEKGKIIYTLIKK